MLCGQTNTSAVSGGPLAAWSLSGKYVKFDLESDVQAMHASPTSKDVTHSQKGERRKGSCGKNLAFSCDGAMLSQRQRPKKDGASLE